MRTPGLYRLVIAWAAWTTVAVIAIGIARVMIPPLAAFLDNSSLGSIVAKVLLVWLLLSTILGWIATLLHVAAHAPLRSPVQRAVIIAFLLVLNMGSPFVYYFAYLFWKPDASTVAAAV